MVAEALAFTLCGQRYLSILRVFECEAGLTLLHLVLSGSSCGQRCRNRDTVFLHSWCDEAMWTGRGGDKRGRGAQETRGIRGLGSGGGRGGGVWEKRGKAQVTWGSLDEDKGPNC